MHDARYQSLFAFPRMIEDLLRGFASRDWGDTLDFPVPVVVEFQSSEDTRMALRILAYTSLLYQELACNHAPCLDEAGRLLVVLLVVVYNGEKRWTAPCEVGELVSYRPTHRHLSG